MGYGAYGCTVYHSRTNEILLRIYENRRCLLKRVLPSSGDRPRLKYDGTPAETRFRLSPKRTSPFKSTGASVHSTAGSRGVRISGSNAGYTMFRGSVKSTGYPLLFASFPFTSPPTRRRVPSHFSWTLPRSMQRIPNNFLSQYVIITVRYLS